MLLRVLAGSGPAGLAAMQPRRGRTASAAARVPARGSRRVPGGPRRGGLGGSGQRRSLTPALVDPHPGAAAPRWRACRTWARGSSGSRSRRAAIVGRGTRSLDVLPGLDPRVEAGGFPLLASRWPGMIPTSRWRCCRRPRGGLAACSGLDVPSGCFRLLRAGRSGRVLELGAAWRVELAFGRLCFYRSSEAAAPAGHRAGARRGALGPLAGAVAPGAGSGARPARRMGGLVHRAGGGPPGPRARGPDPSPGWHRSPAGDAMPAGRTRRAQPSGGLAGRRGGRTARVGGGRVSGRGAVPGIGEDALRIEVSDG